MNRRDLQNLESLFMLSALDNCHSKRRTAETIGMETGISANLFIDDIDRFFNRFNNIRLQAILLDRDTRSATPPDIVLSHILPADENIVLQTVRKFPCKAFAAQSYLEKHGHPQDMNDLINNHRLVCKTYSRYHDEKYLDLLESARHVCYLSDSDHEVVDAARNGAGICILPVCLADSSLVCLNNLDWESSVTIYLFSSRRAIDNPVIGEVVAYFRELFEKR